MGCVHVCVVWGCGVARHACVGWGITHACLATPHFLPTYKLTSSATATAATADLLSTGYEHGHKPE